MFKLCFITIVNQKWGKKVCTTGWFPSRCVLPVTVVAGEREEVMGGS
ncbi:unnamed protein product [Brassica rapa]|uniref:Uncharacterized protein n=1 Tax=Brassica campestris TaxID=3711 RepID=A0A8D9HBR8_BRACM|nr:unnamed protein product [Brassica rapa]